MAKGKLILICRSGGEFATNDDGTLTYNGGEANAANVTSETPFSDLKLNLAETCNFDQETVSVKYFLPGNKRNLITVKNNKDVKRMIDFHGDALTAEVFVMGTPGFVCKAEDVETNRQTDSKNDETVNNDNESTKKDEKVKREKTGPKKEKKVKKDDKVNKTPIAASPAKRTRRAVAAAAKAEASSHEKEKEKEKEKTVSGDDDANKSEDSGSTSDTSSSGASERVNANVDSNCSSDYKPSRYAKRKKGTNEDVTDVNASPADGVKKRRRTPSWKFGANGRPTIVSDSVGSKSRGSASKKSERKSGRLAAKEESSRETKSAKKRGRPRAIKSESVGPSALATCDDDVSAETLVSVWKSSVTGVGQEFKNVHEFQEVLQKYAIANDFEFKFKKNNTKRAVGECASEGCSWKFNASWVPSTQSFKIKTMNNVHTCDNESKNRLIHAINQKLQESPHLKPNEIANGLLKDFGGVESNAKQEVRETESSREQLHGGSDKDSYNKLPWFCDKIVETNPGSISRLVVGENKRFKALFVSFYASLCGFQSCRPLLFLEATSLRSKYGEFLLTANAIDGNDGFFPVAFAIVDAEDDNNWRWFLEQLRAAIMNTQPITFVFDREKNLKSRVLEVFQDSYIGYSIYHLLESFKRTVKGPFHGDGKSFLPVHFLAAAHAVRLVGFRKSTEQIKLISSQAYDWVMQIEPQYYTTSSFKGERYNYIIDDVGEPFTKLMEDFRELPILHKIDAIIRTMIDTFTDAKLDACMWSTHLTPSKEKELQEENTNSCALKVLISSDTLFEVREDSTHVVNTSNWSCTCLGWKETGLPCRHALAVFQLIGKNAYEFCSNYFTVDAYRLTYIESINSVPIEKEEGEKMEVEITWGENDDILKLGGENEEVFKVGGENEEAFKVGGENEEAFKVGGENEEAFKVGGENEEAFKVGGENEEAFKVGGENEEAFKVGGENEEALEVGGGENMEVEITWGENEEALKVGGVNEEDGEKIEVVDIAWGENEELLKVGGGNEESGEKIEVVEENGEKIEGEKEKIEIVEVVEEKGEKEETLKAEGGKVEGEKEQLLKDEGEKGKIMEQEIDDDDSNVFVLPPIPIKPVDEIKENMEWEETEVETKRTVTCTKCKQPGHNKKSCNLYQVQQSC